MVTISGIGKQQQDSKQQKSNMTTWLRYKCIIMIPNRGCEFSCPMSSPEEPRAESQEPGAKVMLCATFLPNGLKYKKGGTLPSHYSNQTLDKTHHGNQIFGGPHRDLQPGSVAVRNGSPRRKTQAKEIKERKRVRGWKFLPRKKENLT